jgi:hypothetical protein
MRIKLLVLAKNALRLCDNLDWIPLPAVVSTILFGEWDKSALRPNGIGQKRRNALAVHVLSIFRRIWPMPSGWKML